MKLSFFVLLALSFLALVTVSASQDEYDQDEEELQLPYVTIPYADDFSKLAEIAREENKIIMLEASASYCGYCELLEEEFIKPMLRNDDYAVDVLIRKIDLDSYQTIIDFSGNRTTPDKFTRRLKVRLTPTILFFDGHGNEVSDRILGINSIELYGGYIDDALESGLRKIKSQ